MANNKMEVVKREPTTVMSAETSGHAAALAAQAENQVKSAVLIAKQFPRDEDTAIQRIERACMRPAMAEKADYSYPRGGGQVQGPSVYLMRAIAQYFGNIEYGFHVIAETDEGALLRAYAWDIESNTRSERDHFVKRLVQRKEGWVRPDERDFREWLGNIGSRLERRCLENVIPRDIVDTAREVAAATRVNQYAKDPDEARKKILAAFNEINVPAKELAEYLNKPIVQASPVEIDMLRGIYRAIKDGEKAWRDYHTKVEKLTGTINPEDIKASKDANRGHDGAMPKSGGKATRKDKQAGQEKQQQSQDTDPEPLTFQSFTAAEINELKPWLDSKGISDRGALEEMLSAWVGTKEALLKRAAAELAEAQKPQQETVSAGSRSLFK
jgi:hypothetical protein